MIFGFPYRRVTLRVEWLSCRRVSIFLLCRRVTLSCWKTDSFSGARSTNYLDTNTSFAIISKAHQRARSATLIVTQTQCPVVSYWYQIIFYRRLGSLSICVCVRVCVWFSIQLISWPQWETHARLPADARIVHCAGHAAVLRTLETA